MAILAIFLVILAVLFNVSERPGLPKKVLSIIPPIFFAYFIPTLLTTFGILPDSSPLYKWIKTFLLPVALFLFTLTLDLKAIMKLGSKAVIMMLTGTLGIVVGGPLSLLLFSKWLPDDAWQGMAALSGSWIGGGVNFVAIGQAVEAPESVLGPIIVVDVVVAASIWLPILLMMVNKKEAFNRWAKADRSSIEYVQKKVENYQSEVARIASFNDLLVILSLAFLFTWLSYWLGDILPPVGDFIKGSVWKVILITGFGILFSFTKFRSYEGAGASKIGNVALYLLIATIGAQANLRGIIEYPVFILAGIVWIAIHALILLIVAKLIRAPYFFAAVGSLANVGGAASAPVLAAAFHPSLAAVGVLLGILGYVLGTYAGLVCAFLLKIVADA